MVDVASISKEAFDAIEQEIDGVIKHANLIVTSGGAYSTTTGSFVGTTTTTFPCRLVFETEKPSKDIFPSYVIGPTDKIAYIEGLSTKPKEAMKISIGSDQLTIAAVADVVGSGQFFAVVLR